MKSKRREVTIFFSVGEPSGDLHGASLIRALTRRHDDIRCVGFGGPRMRDAGCELHEDLTQLALMWFLRVLQKLPQFWCLLVRADRYFRHQRPDAVVLIDYPGFNWWIARRARAHRIPVFYYGAPQMWAWAPWRIRKMRRLVDHVLCKLPFEAEWYQSRGCNATYIGHPYFDATHDHPLDRRFVAQQRSSSPLVTLLPGSRTQEVHANLEVFLRTAEQIHAKLPEVRFAVAAFSSEHAKMVAQQVNSVSCRGAIEIHVGKTPELIDAANVCLACSGSVSLEMLHYEKPAIIHYRVSSSALRIQACFRTVRYITLVNLLACEDRFCMEGSPTDSACQESVPYPEYLTAADRSHEIARRIVHWLTDTNFYEKRVGQLRSLKQRFGGPGASERAAHYLVEHIQRVENQDQLHYRPPQAA